MRVGDQSAVPRETSEDRQIALGDAEGHVDLRRIAPLGDDLATAQQQPIRPAARPHRTQGFVPWRPLAEIGQDHLGEIAFPRRFMLGSVAREGGHRGGIKPGIGRLTGRPSGGVRRREVCHYGYSGTAISLEFRPIRTTS